jgi:ABC-type sugar transport system ATPase subunit
VESLPGPWPGGLVPRKACNMSIDGNSAGTDNGKGTAIAARPRLSMHGITKSFGEVTVLRSVDLEVGPGEIHGLVGQNGAGKSTLTRILAGGYPDYHGSIEIDGEPVFLRAPQEALKRGVAVIYQEFSLVPQLSVAENIVLGTEPGTIAYKPRAVRRLAERLVREVGMAGALPLDSAVASLSAAVQQRVEIAKALTRNAKLLVLDEPTSRLAGPDRERLFSLMRRIASNGTALVFISHFLDEVLRVSSRLTVLRDGAVVATAESSAFDPVSLGHALMGRALEEQEAREEAAPPSVGEDVAISVDRVSCGRQTREVSFFVRRGEIVGLAGLVGSGRSTLAKALVGAVPLVEGTISISGRPVRLRSPRHALRAGIALVPEDRRAQGLVRALPASENLMLMSLARASGQLGLVNVGRLRRNAKRAIADFSVRPPDDTRRAGTFSGGNQQKLLLARAILAQPDVLVVDQPTAGVDVGTKAQIHRVLRAMAGQGKAVLVVSDDVEEILALSDRLLIMRNGRIVAERRRGAVDRGDLVALISVGPGSKVGAVSSGGEP